MSARAWIAFAAVSTLWGIPYLFIKIAVDDGVPPAFLAWVRVVLGGAVLLGLAWSAGVLAPLRGRWRWLAVFAVVEIVIPFPLIAAGEQHVDSSLAAIIVAAAPLFVALLAVVGFDDTERVSGSRLGGCCSGSSASSRSSGSMPPARARSCSAPPRSCSRPSATRSGR